MPPNQPAPERAFWVQAAQGVSAVIAIATVLSGVVWYAATQRDGGAPMYQMQATVAGMQVAVNAGLRAAEASRDRDSEELRRVAREMADLRVALERSRADLEAERRIREDADLRVAAELEWVRRQILDMRTALPRPRSDGPDSFDIEPSMPPAIVPDVREAMRRPQLLAIPP